MSSLPTLTPKMLSQSRAIAKGIRIRDINRLRKVARLLEFPEYCMSITGMSIPVSTGLK
jgi:hypothetical protein